MREKSDFPAGLSESVIVSFGRNAAGVGKLLALRKKEREYGRFGMTVFRVHAVRDVSSRSTVFVPGFIRFLVPDFKEKRRLGAFDFRHFSGSCAGSVRCGFVPALRLKY